MVKKIKDEDMTQIRISKKNRDLINIAKERYNVELATPRGEIWDQNDALAELVRIADESRHDGEKFCELLAAKPLDVKEITQELTPEGDSTVSEVVKEPSKANPDDDSNDSN